MAGYQADPVISFTKRFRRSPVRWVVLAHAALLMIIVLVGYVAPMGGAMWWLDASLVLAQIALLLIWMTLDGATTIRRTFGVAIVVVLMQMIHALPYGYSWVGPSMVCSVVSMFIALTILALPLSIAQWKGLQIRRFAVKSMPPARRLQFSIRSVLVASVVVAVLFGLKGIPEMLDRQPGSGGNSFGAALAIVVMALIAAAIYLSIPLVAVWAVLTPGKILPRLATAAVGWGLGTALALHYTGIEKPDVQLTIPAIPTAGGILILLATLLVLRTMRYRTVWEKGGQPAASPLLPSSPFAAEDALTKTARESAYPEAEDNSGQAVVMGAFSCTSPIRW